MNSELLKQVKEIISGTRSGTTDLPGSPSDVEEIYKSLTSLKLDRKTFEQNDYRFDWRWKVEIAGIKIMFNGCGWDSTIYAKII